MKLNEIHLKKLKHYRIRKEIELDSDNFFGKGVYNFAKPILIKEPDQLRKFEPMKSNGRKLQRSEVF